jgi:hypothetical protein
MYEAMSQERSSSRMAISASDRLGQGVARAARGSIDELREVDRCDEVLQSTRGYGCQLGNRAPSIGDRDHLAHRCSRDDRGRVLLQRRDANLGHVLHVEHGSLLTCPGELAAARRGLRFDFGRAASERVWA